MTLQQLRDQLAAATRSYETANRRNAALLEANAQLRERVNAPLTVWRAYYRDTPSDGFTIGIFRAEAPARTACEDLLRCEQAASTDAAALTWWCDEDDPEEPRELAVTLSDAVKAFGTGYCVVPVVVQNRYDPEAGE